MSEKVIASPAPNGVIGFITHKNGTLYPVGGKTFHPNVRELQKNSAKDGAWIMPIDNLSFQVIKDLT